MTLRLRSKSSDKRIVSRARDSLYFEYNGKSLIPLLQAVLIMSQCQPPDKATGEQQRPRHVTHILSNGLSQNFRHRLSAYSYRGALCCPHLDQLEKGVTEVVTNQKRGQKPPLYL